MGSRIARMLPSPQLKIIGIGIVALGSFLGDIIGGKLFDKLKSNRTSRFEYDEDPNGKLYLVRREDDDDNHDDFTGGGNTGGVEFQIPKEISNFKELLYFENLFYQNILFDNEFGTTKDILEVANRFVINKIYKFYSVNQVFQTILTEIYGGFLGLGILPFVSLNFNSESLLYSIMPDYYKQTLVGNILGYLDYFLKGFVNGGFFKEEFANNWHINENFDINYLNNNFINLKKYIFENKEKIQQSDYYVTVYDLGETLSDKTFHKNSLSAFRIIGTINRNILIKNNVIIPRCSFRVESDFNIFPKYLNESKNNNNINNVKEIEKTKEGIKAMKYLIRTLMPQIPYFRGYFNILDMITFAIHYISTLDANAVFPNMDESLLFENNKKPYVSLLPPVFPPLPVKKQIVLNVNLIFSYAFNNFLTSEEKDILNNMISEKNLNEIKLEKIVVSLLLWKKIT